MRDRLIELSGNIISSCKANLCSDCEHNNIDYPCCMSEHFADHILADGWMRPPCKVGQIVYLIKDGFIERCEVEGIHYTRRSNYARIRPFHQDYWGNWSVYYKPSIRSFGKTVFLTREEAEKALKGGEQK